MKRALGALIANWFRKPENRRKAKQTAQKAWNSFQQRKTTASKTNRTPTRDHR